MQGWLRRATPTSSATSCRGALVGAIIGLVIGALARAIVGSGSLLIYEIVAGLAGVVLGADPRGVLRRRDLAPPPRPVSGGAPA